MITKLPPASQLPALAQTIRIIAQPLQFLEECAKNYGDTFTLRLLGFQSPPVVFCSHPQAIETIFNTDATKFDWGKMTYIFQPLTGDKSLILQAGKGHKRLRKILMPPLHGKQLPNYGKLICEITKTLTTQWQPDTVISIRESMLEISLQVILRVVFGLKPGARYEKLQRLIAPFVEEINSPFNSIQFFLSPLQQDLGKWSPWGRFLRQQQAIDQLIYAEIAKRRTKRVGDDILSLLISARDEAGQSLTDQELRDQLITLLLLGHETTASVLAWAFYWIHHQPSVLKKLMQELEGLGKLIWW